MTRHEHTPAEMRDLQALAGVKDGRLHAVARLLSAEGAGRCPRTVDGIRRGALCDAPCRWLQEQIDLAAMPATPREDTPCST